VNGARAPVGRRSQGAAQVTVKIPPAPVWHMLPQLTLERQVHAGVDPQPPGSGRQAYDGVLPGTPPMVTWQYVVATAHDAHELATQAPAWSSCTRARARSQSFE
jgi:hypothetical protein